MANHPETSREHNNNRTGYFLNIIFLCSMILISLIVCLILFLRVQRLEARMEESGSDGDEVLYTQTDMDRAVLQARATERRNVMLQIQSSLESGNSMLSMLREIFPETVVVVHDGRYFFYPLQGNLAANPYPRGSFAEDESGRMVYAGDDSRIRALCGVAVSQESGTIDWESAVEDQVSFAMLRALSAERDESGAVSYEEDERARDYAAQAMQAGIRIGFYADLDAMTAEEADREAEMALSLIPSGLTEPCVVAACLEVPDADDPLAGMSAGSWTTCAKVFCGKIREAGHTPVLCGSAASLNIMLDLSEFEDVDKWLTGTTDPSVYPYAFKWWEYSVSGNVSGIDGEARMLLEMQRAEE